MDTTWTTLHVAQAALSAGHVVSVFTAGDVEVDVRGALRARVSHFDRPLSAEHLTDALREHTATRLSVRLDRLDRLLLRASPVDTALLAFALRLVDLGVEVVNHPAAALKVAHKSWLATLPDVATPRTVVTAYTSTGHLFLDEVDGPVVVKPAQGSGGRAVGFIGRGDHAGLDCAAVAASERSRHVVIQSYLPAAERGEKRLVWMDGEILGGYLRERAEGELRHNLKQGGQARAVDITDDDRLVIAPLSRHLLQAGVRLVGIDLIGEHVVEVNALNPGGAFHADRLHNTDVAGAIVARLCGDGRPSALRSEPWPRPVP